jgi:hypothetical protein
MVVVMLDLYSHQFHVQMRIRCGDSQPVVFIYPGFSLCTGRFKRCLRGIHSQHAQVVFQVKTPTFCAGHSPKLSLSARPNRGEKGPLRSAPRATIMTWSG